MSTMVSKGLSGVRYSQPLACVGLEALHFRRLKCHLMCGKVIDNQITMLIDDVLVFSDCTNTRAKKDCQQDKLPIFRNQIFRFFCSTGATCCTNQGELGPLTAFKFFCYGTVEMKLAF